MSAGTAYSKRYAGGFFDKPSTASPIDATYLNAIETALLQLIGSAPTADAQVMQWDFANTRFGPALLLNKNVDPAAAISKSKLDFTGANGIVNADVAGAAAIARSKLDFGAGLVNGDISTAAAIGISKLASYPSDIQKVLKGDGTWGYPTPGVYRKVTSKTVNTTVAATDLLNGEITIAANVMGSTGVLRGTLMGDWLQNSGAGAVGPRFQLVFGGTTLLDTGAAQSITNSATRLGWGIEFEIGNLTTTTQAAWIRVWLTTVAGATAGTTQFTTGLGQYRTEVNSEIVGYGTTTSSKDTTTALALVLNVINGSASATYETRLQRAVFEII